jgi:hypothetical protein
LHRGKFNLLYLIINTVCIENTGGESSGKSMG